jgi:electron transport complex protein RnfG
MTQAVITRSTLTLALFALGLTGIVSMVALQTADAIEEAKQRARERSLAELISAESYDNRIFDTEFPAPSTEIVKLSQHTGALKAKLGDRVTAVILTVVAPDGYSGDIEIMVAINSELAIEGARVIAHKETPGLGDKIDIQKSAWITYFEGANLDDDHEVRWRVKKDGGEFDQFTGATITPRAVIRTLHGSLLYARDHYQALFERPFIEVSPKTLQSEGK